MYVYQNYGFKETFLRIKAKNRKYTQLAEKLLEFLNSTSHEATFSG
jgi:hypothetical protein